MKLHFPDRIISLALYSASAQSFPNCSAPDPVHHSLVSTEHTLGLFPMTRGKSGFHLDYRISALLHNGDLILL